MGLCMPSEFPCIAAVILHYKGLEDTLNCLGSLAASTVRADWIIVVNNGSEPTGHIVDGLENIGRVTGAVPLVLHAEHVEDIQTLLAQAAAPYEQGKLFCIEAKRNRGYGAGNNLGLALALALGADAVWLLNNDTRVAPEALGIMREKLFSNNRAGLCGPLIRYMDQPDIVQCRGGGWTNPWTCLSRLDGGNISVEEALAEDEAVVEARLNFIYGAAVMVSRDFLTTVGLLDEHFFLYCEEQDWAFRAAGRFSLAYACKAHVWHREGASTGWSATTGNLFAVKHLIRSRLLLAWKHNPAALPIVCLAIVFAVARGLCRRLRAISL